ncbi:MAG: LptF/LptG family permease [Xanthobacteraceae bacterium]
MGSIGWYMFRTTMGAFLITVVSLTVVMWFTQAIREFDLITSQRQTLFVFIGITGLFIPLLVMMIAPIALVLAVSHVLNKLSSDSEIIVMNAAGVSPWRLVRPFIAVALVVSLLVTTIAVYISPRSLRELRDWGTQVRADILTNIVQPGRFTYPAEQGEIVKNDTGSFLVLEKGSVQRIEAGQRDLRIVTFDRYAFDLSKFTGSPQSVVYNTREKYVWELMWPRPEDGLHGAPLSEYRSELHDRFVTPLYPLAFAILAYAFLGPPQTTRQSRTLALLALVGVVSLLRLIGFLSVIIGTRIPAVLAVQYIALIGSIIAGSWQISRGRAIEPAAVVSKIAIAITERFAKATAG